MLELADGDAVLTYTHEDLLDFHGTSSPACERQRCELVAHEPLAEKQRRVAPAIREPEHEPLERRAAIGTPPGSRG